MYMYMTRCTVALLALLVSLSLPARAAYTAATVKGSCSFSCLTRGPRLQEQILHHWAF